MSQSVYWEPAKRERQGGYGPRVKRILLNAFPDLDRGPVTLTGQSLPVLRGMRAASDGQDEAAFQEMEDAIQNHGAIRVEISE